MSALVEQFAMFMQRRDAIEQGGIIQGVARPTWEELGEAGQEAYVRDAVAYVGALALLGFRSSELPVTDAEVEAAAEALWKRQALGTYQPNYPYSGLAEEGRERLRAAARDVLEAARGVTS